MSKLATVLDYHQRSKHRLERYAAGPETLDWELQPDPFRRFSGCSIDPLPLLADTVCHEWQALFQAGQIPPQAFNRASLALLLELSMGLAAWKQYGPDRWALRCTPSSGNLHPTETYVLAHGVTGVADGLYHYAPREHALERRATLSPERDQERAHLWFGFSSIHWREAWKYGERAFRYCQLDLGHAIGALRYAAALLGWQARVLPMAYRELTTLLGTDRTADFADVEAEEAELLVELLPPQAATLLPRGWTADGDWSGIASRLDHGRRFYQWPIIEQVALATRSEVATAVSAPEPSLASTAVSTVPGLCASTLIRQRRSAQHFDRRARMPASDFFAMIGSIQAECLPLDIWPHPPRVHPVIFTLRVEGLPSGAWVLARDKHGAELLHKTLSGINGWQSAAAHGATGLPLFLLAEHAALSHTLRQLCCHQGIAANACFVVAMLAEFSAPLRQDPAYYRRLFQEAGLLGQVLYLEAEARGWRGTGIGCFFDDALHALLGITDQRLQALYHFSVGMPVPDSRITTEAPYVGRPTRE